MQYILFVILAPIAAVITIGLAVYAWRHRSVPTAAALGGCALVITGWLIFNTLEVADPTESGTLVWARLTYLFIGFAPVAWLAFALRYTGRQRWLAPKRLWVLGVLPTVFFLLTLTDDLHHLIWIEYSFHPESGLFSLWVDAYGPWFWVQAAYNYALVVLGAVLIGRAYLVSHRLYRQQTLWAIIGATTPLIFNLVYVARLIPGLRKDYSPLAWAFGGLAFAVAIFRHRLFDLMPVARQVLVDSMDDGMLVLDERDRIVDLNPAAQAIVGASAGQALGYPAGQVWSTWGDLADELRRRPQAPPEIALERNGEERYYDVRISRLVDRHGRPTGRLVVLRDVTQRKEAEEMLRQSNLELQARNAELDAFAHTVAHDVKGPLATIASYAEMLLQSHKDTPESERADLLQALHRSSWKAANIVNELLLLASVRRVEEVELEPLDMAGIVAEVQRRLADLIEEYAAEIVVPEKWPKALGRDPWVEEVWVNYVSNAIKHGGMPPRVELGATEQEDGTIRFWVRDNCAGLTTEEQARLFKPFTQLQQVGAGGHGLGLSIAQRIVEKMGGQVGVESEGIHGKGCTFSFVLPGARGQ